MEQDPRPGEDEDEILEVVGVREEDGIEIDEVVSFEDAPPPAPDAPRETDAEQRLVRLRADFDNLRKRIDREREQYHRHATATLIARLLPVLDNFERALASMQQRAEGDSTVEGVALIHRQLLDELRREGLRPVDAVGHPFDPAVHEAVATEPGSRIPANIVVEELQRGYFLEDRLLRPSMVRVSVHAAHPADAPGKES
jgi:molecular chaperone GrpE